MNEKIIKLVNRYGRHLCTLAVVSATMASQACRVLFYQPEEPDGLADFAKKKGDE